MKKAIVIAFCGIGCGMMIAHAAITQLPFNAAALPKGIVCTGRVVDGARWTDSTGENIVVLCQTGAFKSPKGDSEDSRDAELSAHQYVRSAPAWKRVWSIRDFERNCPLDLTATFIPGALTVTDLDGNGIAEVTVLYKHACRGDVSPAGMKLIMREGAKKYAIRGIMRISPEIDPSGRGEMNLDPAFAKAPRGRSGISRYNTGRSMKSRNRSSSRDRRMEGGRPAPMRTAHALSKRYPIVSRNSS